MDGHPDLEGVLRAAGIDLGALQHMADEVRQKVADARNHRSAILRQLVFDARSRERNPQFNRRRPR